MDNRSRTAALVRAVLRRCLTVLTKYGPFMAGAEYVWMQTRIDAAEDVVPHKPPIEGPPPGHPERLDPEHVPSNDERRLWAQLS